MPRPLPARRRRVGGLWVVCELESQGPAAHVRPAPFRRARLGCTQANRTSGQIAQTSARRCGDAGATPGSPSSCCSWRRPRYTCHMRLELRRAHTTPAASRAETDNYKHGNGLFFGLLVLYQKRPQYGRMEKPAWICEAKPILECRRRQRRQAGNNSCIRARTRQMKYWELMEGGCARPEADPPR